MSGITGTSHSKSKVIGISKDTARVWVRFDASAVAQDSFGVSTMADSGTGEWTVNFRAPFTNINYAAAVMCQDWGGNYMHLRRIASQATTSCIVNCIQNNAYADSGNNHLIIFGD